MCKLVVTIRLSYPGERRERKRVVQSGDGQSRAFVVCMFMPRLGLFGCRRPSHSLESLISLCFKRACVPIASYFTAAYQSR
jgi:hypothetical protein